jgi:hypothetical protein
MAFRRQGLVRLAAGYGPFSLWHYDAGEDGPDAVLADNYFAEVYRALSAGDRMMVTARNGEHHFDLYVEKIAPGEVSTAAVVSMFQNKGFQDIEAIKRRNQNKKGDNGGQDAD